MALIHRITTNLRLVKILLVSLVFVFANCLFVLAAEAATLSLSPNTGVYTANGTFSVNVRVSTGGQAINAAEGTLSFNPRELTVVSASRSNSIFNLWVAEPSYSNSAGTISFSGGSPAGYSGNTGTIMTVTFRAAGAGTARVSFTNGSVLANDGRGTNILTAMNGGSYTIQAASIAPEPEVIEYVAPANTPAAPDVTSKTHPSVKSWYATDLAELAWTLPGDVTAVRTLLDQNPSTIPTKVYDDPIKNITLEDLPDGESYFHIQFKNGDGWGRVTHYRLGVDTTKPNSIDIGIVDGADQANPNQILKVKVEDDTSVIERYKVKIDNADFYEFIDETGSSTIDLPTLDPGDHAVIIEAFDQAGNSIIGTFSFTILAFDKPIFTEYPTQINEEVIPVIKGLTRPGATVQVTVARVGGEPSLYSVTSSETGEFVFIPEGTFSTGSYELTARASDQFGAQSELSDPIRIAVQQPGYLRIGSLIVSVLSVLVPLVVLVALLVLGLWYLLLYARRFRRKVRIESTEALEILHREFSSLQSTLRDQENALRESRKTKKLTKAEAGMIEVLDQAFQASQASVEKEIQDVKELTRKESKD